MGSKEKRKAENSVGNWQHNSQTKTSWAANLGYIKKLHFRTEAGKELDLRSISDSHLFPGYNIPGYNLPGLDISNMMSVNNYVCS